MKIKHLLPALGLVAVVVLAVVAKGPSVKRMSAYGYIGRSNGATLIVDMDLARFRGDKKYIPIGIWLGYNDSGALKLNRGSFTLTDPAGKVHKVPSPRELTRGYGPTMISADYTYYRHINDYGSMAYLSYHYIPGVAFFANPSGSPGVLYDHVELPMRTFFRSIVYFKNPAGKADGAYTLTFKDSKGKVKMSIPFKITWSK